MKLSKKSTILLSALIIVFSIFIAYHNVITGEFLFDDTSSIIDNPTIKNLDNFTKFSFWFSPQIINRPLSLLTFAINYHFSDLNTEAYHITNIFIHIANTLLIFYLLITILKLQKIAIDNRIVIGILLVCLIFGLHPIQTQAVSYIVQRMSALAALFYIASIITYIHFRISIENNKNYLLSFFQFLLLCIFAMAAIFSKQNAATLPLMIIATESIILKPVCKKYSNCFSISIAGVLLLILFFFFSIKQNNVLSHRIDSYSYYVTQCKLFFKYIRISILPYGQNIDHKTELSHTLWGIHEISGFVISIALFLAASFIKKIPRLIRFGILWILITSIIESTIIPISDLFVEHRMYLPFVGVSIIILSLLLMKIEKSYRLIFLVLSVYVAILGIITINRNYAWQSKIALWEDSVRKSPNNARALNNLGFAYQENGDHQKAICTLKKSLLIAPENTFVLNNLGRCYYELGKKEYAVLYFKKVLKKNSTHVYSLNNLGIYYMEGGKYKEAEKLFSKAIKYNKNHIISYSNLAQLLTKEGRYNEAIPIIKKGLFFDRSNENLNMQYVETIINAGKCNLIEIELDKKNKYIETVQIRNRIHEMCDF